MRRVAVIGCGGSGKTALARASRVPTPSSSSTFSRRTARRFGAALD